MAMIGLFGDELDECVRLLKMRIEDAGHTARVVNLRRFPRVTRGTVDTDRVLHDGIDLLDMDAFFLREIGLRDPFFHTTYTKEFWEALRERYVDFSAQEAQNVSFARAVVEIVALKKPIVNAPSVCGYRRHVAYELDLLSRRGLNVVAFEAGAPPAAGDPSFHESLPLDLDEDMTWDVLTFPKGVDAVTQIRRERIGEAGYTLVVVGNRSLDCALAQPAGETRCRLVGTREIPAGVEKTALEAARAIGAAFAEVELRYAGADGDTYVVKVDPSPCFAYWEAALGLGVSGPLAEYLIEIAR